MKVEPCFEQSHTTLVYQPQVAFAGTSLKAPQASFLRIWLEMPLAERHAPGGGRLLSAKQPPTSVPRAMPWKWTRLKNGSPRLN